MNINIQLLDYMIDIAELQEVLVLKLNAVREQRFDDAAKILEKQREIQARLLTSEQLKQLREQLKQSK